MSLLILKFYTLVKRPNRFHIGVNSKGCLVSQCFGMKSIPEEKAATLLLGCVTEKQHIA